MPSFLHRFFLSFFLSSSLLAARWCLSLLVSCVICQKLAEQRKRNRTWTQKHNRTRRNCVKFKARLQFCMRWTRLTWSSRVEAWFWWRATCERKEEKCLRVKLANREWCELWRESGKWNYPLFLFIRVPLGTSRENCGTFRIRPKLMEHEEEIHVAVSRYGLRWRWREWVVGDKEIRIENPENMFPVHM